MYSAMVCQSFAPQPARRRRSNPCNRYRPRNIDYSALGRAADYIEANWRAMNYQPVLQNFTARSKRFSNISTENAISAMSPGLIADGFTCRCVWSLSLTFISISINATPKSRRASLANGGHGDPGVGWRYGYFKRRTKLRLASLPSGAPLTTARWGWECDSSEDPAFSAES